MIAVRLKVSAFPSPLINIGLPQGFGQGSWFLVENFSASANDCNFSLLCAIPIATLASILYVGGFPGLRFLDDHAEMPSIAFSTSSVRLGTLW